MWFLGWVGCMLVLKLLRSVLTDGNGADPRSLRSGTLHKFPLRKVIRDMG